MNVLKSSLTTLYCYWKPSRALHHISEVVYMQKREVLSFIISDRGREVFNVIEPIFDISWIEQKILEQRKKGRDIYWYSSVKPVNIAKKDYQEQFGYTYTMDSVFLLASERSDF